MRFLLTDQTWANELKTWCGAVASDQCSMPDGSCRPAAWLTVACLSFLFEADGTEGGVFGAVDLGRQGSYFFLRGCWSLLPACPPTNHEFIFLLVLGHPGCPFRPTGSWSERPPRELNKGPTPEVKRLFLARDWPTFRRFRTTFGKRRQSVRCT